MTVSERFEVLKKKYQYDAKAAEKKIKFIEKHCRHVEGDLYGQPLILPEVYKDEILRPIFGLYKQNGKRLIRTVHLQKPRKNAKSTLGAAIELILQYTDGENSAQIYNCAGNDEQAGLLFDMTRKMVELDPTLSEASEVFRSSITYPKRKSFIKKITSKSGTKHGQNAHGILYDEIHVAPNRDLYDTLKTSQGQRSNPMFISITTPGHDKTSIAYNLYEYSKKILNGIIEDDTFWCVVYESEPEDDIYAEETWRKANPLYDYSENLRDYIKTEANKASNDTSYENTFRRLHLGQWTSSETKWIKSEMWRGLEGKISSKEFSGDYTWMGLDLSATSDLTSLCRIYYDGDVIIPFWDLWIPEAAAIDYERKFNIPYSKWAKEGWISIIEGNTIDFRMVEEQVVKHAEENSIKMIGYDEWNSRDLATRLQETHGLPLIINHQGYRLSGALKKIKELILSGKIIHNGNPVVMWAFDNILVKENDELNIKIVKPKGEKKIDPWISFAMAINEWMIDIPRKSVYSDRGVTVID
jgi:phage terminase large subunit-like protein